MTPSDLVIVGGGPAGWSAALMLGRCRRSVVLIDAGRPRNAASLAVHGFLTRDGTPPADLLALARRDALRYPSVTAVEGRVVRAERREAGFDVELADGRHFASRKLLIASGVTDDVPPLPGMDLAYGRSVHHCPYCDGWEHRDEPIAVYGRGEKGTGLALMLTLWSPDVVLCTDGEDGEAAAEGERLARHGVRIEQRRVAGLEVQPDGTLQAIRFADGGTLERSALFFNTGQHLRKLLVDDLGCELDDKGGVVCQETEETSVPGVYAAGDASRDVLFVIVAAAEGAKAAKAINHALLVEEGRA